VNMAGVLLWTVCVVKCLVEIICENVLLLIYKNQLCW
jgi:hypothetical protein